MSREDALLLLRTAKGRLNAGGYAYDLVTALLNGLATAYDADCLFRTLMLDENWDLRASKAMFEAADLIALLNDAKPCIAENI